LGVYRGQMASIALASVSEWPIPGAPGHEITAAKRSFAVCEWNTDRYSDRSGAKHDDGPADNRY